MSNKTFDILKWVCMIVMPAVITLYTTLSTLWGWPYADLVVGSMAAVNTFVGAVLGISAINYTKAKDNE